MRKYVKCFDFGGRFIRDKLTFSDPTKIRLNPDTHQLELKVQSVEATTGRNIYPTDADLHVRIQATNPESLVKLMGFSAIPRPTLQPDDTTVAYKLNDGTDDYFWDGGAWALAGASDWNSEQDVVANVAAFDTTSRQFGIVINLATVDKYSTPVVRMLDVLMECDLSYIRSIVRGALMADMQEAFRIKVNLGFDSYGGSKHSLKDLETPFNIVEVLGIYNHSDDPTHQTNLLDSYDDPGKIIRTTADIPRGRDVWVDLWVAPEIYLNFGDQDYIEVSKIPAVVLERVSANGHEVQAEMSAKNIVDGTATVLRVPFWMSMTFNVELIAEGNRTLLEMWDRALEYHANTPLLRWRAVDELISMRTSLLGATANSPNLRNEYGSGYTLILENIHLWLRREEVKPLVQEVVLALSADRC